MAYFTDPMAEEFRKAIEDALKEAGRYEDPDAGKRAKERKNSNSERPSRSKRKRSREPGKKLSPKIAKSLK